MMATRPMNPLAVDLNDPGVLCLYNELLLFRANSSEELTFQRPDQMKQKILHSIADALELDYEYWKSLRQVRISKHDANEEQTNLFSSHSVDACTAEFPNCLLEKAEFGDDQEMQGLSSLTDFSNWSYPAYGDDFNESPFEFSHQGDMPPLNSKETSSLFDQDQEIFSPTPTPSSSSRPSSAAAAHDELAAIFTDTPFFKSRRNSSKVSSKPGSRVISRTASRAESAISTTSEQGITKVSRRSSSSNHCAGFQEFVFNSHPSRPASRLSGSSVRRGTMDAMARAAMKAVKALGACWRCKWLRKDCNEDTPCSSCPKGSRKSPWLCVGCRRGDLESQMLDIPLCNFPRPDYFHHMTETPLPSPTKQTPNIDDLRRVLTANSCLQKAHLRRSQDTATGNQLIASEWYEDDRTSNQQNYDPFLFNTKNRWPELGCVKMDQISSLTHPHPAAVRPLDDCLLDILWEYFDDTVVKYAISASDSTLSVYLLILLRSAALYQAKQPTECDHLIARSLTCLRDCFEALRVNVVGCLTDNVHNTCDESFCKVDCISNLTASISTYIDELSRVFFKKENMRSKSWWLSVFYSLCIQSIVRQALIQLSCAPGMSVDAFSGARQYLYLPLQLFNATSGTYDPLCWDLSLQSDLPSNEASLLEDVQRAKFATDQGNWKELGINSSMDYLNQLFDSDGETFLSRDSGRDNFLTLRGPAGL